MNTVQDRYAHGGNIYDDAPPHGTWLDFSANINPFGLSMSARRAIADGIDAVTNYPDPKARELTYNIANTYGANEKNIVLGNGATELMYLFFHTLRPRRTLIVAPAFNEYERAALAAKSEVRRFFTSAEDGFRVDWTKFADTLSDIDCAVVANPNNPTGVALAADEQRRLLKIVAKHDIALLYDESFADFFGDNEPSIVAAEADDMKNAFVVHSLTKFFALPGLRLGFGIACKNLAKKLNDGKDVWNVNILAQRAGVASLADEEYRRRTVAWLREEGTRFVAALRALPHVTIFPPSVNFVLLRLENMTACECAARMRRRGILVRNCDNFPGLDGRYIRVAVKSTADNDEFLRVFAQVLND